MPVALRRFASKFELNHPVVNRNHALARYLDFAVVQHPQGSMAMDKALGTVPYFNGVLSESAVGTLAQTGTDKTGSVDGRNGPVLWPNAWPYHHPPNQFPFSIGFHWQMYGSSKGTQIVYICGGAPSGGNQSGITCSIQTSLSRFALSIGDGTGTATTDVKQWQIPNTFGSNAGGGLADQGSVLWVFRSLTDVSAYVNGLDVSSTFTFTGTGTVWGEIATPNDPTIGCQAFNGNLLMSSCYVPLVCKWSDDLTDREAVDFHMNPFEMFGARPLLIRLPPPPVNYTDSATIAVVNTPGGIEGLSPQDAYPIADVSAGSWTASGGGTLWDKIDEEPIVDTDYIQSDAAH